MSKLLEIFELDPIRMFRINYEDSFFDILIPDVYDVSTIVNITDMYGVQVPFDQWDTYSNLLLVHLKKNVY